MQGIKLTKNQMKKAKQQTRRNIEKKLNSPEDSSSSEKGKRLEGGKIEEPDTIENLSNQIYHMKKKYEKQDEIIFNMADRIRELLSTIEDLSQETQCLRRQLIQSRVVTKQQLYIQSQSNISKNDQTEISDFEEQQKENQTKDQSEQTQKIIERIQRLENKIMPKKVNFYSKTDSANRIVTYTRDVRVIGTSKSKKAREHETNQQEFTQRKMEFTRKELYKEPQQGTMYGNHPIQKWSWYPFTKKKLAAGPSLNPRKSQLYLTFSILLLLLLIVKLQIKVNLKSEKLFDNNMFYNHNLIITQVIFNLFQLFQAFLF